MMNHEKNHKQNIKRWMKDDVSQSDVERLVKTKTENIERVIGRFYIEYLKGKRAGVQNKFGELDGFTDGMDKLAYAVIKREEF